MGHWTKYKDIYYRLNSKTGGWDISDSEDIKTCCLGMYASWMRLDEAIAQFKGLKPSITVSDYNRRMLEPSEECDLTPSEAKMIGYLRRKHLVQAELLNYDRTRGLPRF